MKKISETLNLPKTEFKMKADLPKREPEIIEFWNSNKIYQKMIDKNSGNDLFILHDGPPYANGNIHLGHALNKILKDIIVKFKSMSGFRTPFIPGWDTHGLPTELKVMSKIGSDKFGEFSDVELRNVCKKTALKYLDIQRDEFKRLGIFADWENPYVTLNPEFESGQIEVFAKMVENGAIYRGMKPVYWCSCCKTALAEAEIEYKEDDCDSVFVKFRLNSNEILKKDENKFINYIKSINLNLSKIFLLIWTTTIWTLPANVAICLNSKFYYSLVKSDDEFYIVASELAKKCFEKKSNYEVLSEFKGEIFENLFFSHPFLNKNSRVILGNHVTLESGTGCVHTAPGHGLEDFEVCMKYGMDIVVPVNGDGVLTEEAGDFSGLDLNSANIKIKERLDEDKLLFLSKKIKHKYPHCWRCKNPVIFRATKQWFCSVNKFKDEALAQIDNVKWMPSWGKERISLMVNERSDWCISRQRRWGVPIPIVICTKCNEPVLDVSFIKKVACIFKIEGSDSWYKNPVEYFVDGSLKCSKCNESYFEKELDIMDVWFDSGTTYKSVLKGKEFPADLYLEGSDQHRGWFQSSLLTSVCSTGVAPYKSVLTHGWVVDDYGKKQSKSLGNVISPQEVISYYGADILRLWVSSVDYKNDVKISQKILLQISEFYRKFRNTARYIIGNIYDFDVDKDFIKISDLLSIDKFILYNLNVLNEKCLKAYENFEFHIIFHLVQKFCIIDLSNFYLDVIKDRLYVSKKDSLERRSAQTVIYTVLKVITKIMAPIMSFTAEEIWGFISSDKNESIFLNKFNNHFLNDNFDDLVKKWNKIISIVDDVKIKLEEMRAIKFIGSSLEASVVFYAKGENFKFISLNIENFKDSLIVSDLKVVNDYLEETSSLKNHKNIYVKIVKASGKKCERCWMYIDSIKIDEEYGYICERCSNVLR